MKNIILFLMILAGHFSDLKSNAAPGRRVFEMAGSRVTGLVDDVQRSIAVNQYQAPSAVPVVRRFNPAQLQVQRHPVLAQQIPIINSQSIINSKPSSNQRLLDIVVNALYVAPESSIVRMNSGSTLPSPVSSHTARSEVLPRRYSAPSVPISHSSKTSVVSRRYSAPSILSNMEQEGDFEVVEEVKVSKEKPVVSQVKKVPYTLRTPIRTRTISKNVLKKSSKKIENPLIEDQIIDDQIKKDLEHEVVNDDAQNLLPDQNKNSTLTKIKNKLKNTVSSLKKGLNKKEENNNLFDDLTELDLLQSKYEDRSKFLAKQQRGKPSNFKGKLFSMNEGEGVEQALERYSKDILNLTDVSSEDGAFMLYDMQEKLNSNGFNLNSQDRQLAAQYLNTCKNIAHKVTKPQEFSETYFAEIEPDQVDSMIDYYYVKEIESIANNNLVGTTPELQELYDKIVKISDSTYFFSVSSTKPKNQDASEIIKKISNFQEKMSVAKILKRGILNLIAKFPVATVVLGIGVSLVIANLLVDASS